MPPTYCHSDVLKTCSVSPCASPQRITSQEKPTNSLWGGHCTGKVWINHDCGCTYWPLTKLLGLFPSSLCDFIATHCRVERVKSTCVKTQAYEAGSSASTPWDTAIARAQVLGQLPGKPGCDFLTMHQGSACVWGHLYFSLCFTKNLLSYFSLYHSFKKKSVIPLAPVGFICWADFLLNLLPTSNSRHHFHHESLVQADNSIK